MVLSAGIVLGIYIFGSLGIAMILAPEEITKSLNVGPMEMFRVFLQAHGLGFISPILAACVCIGVLGHISTWVIGPTEAIRRASKRRDLPEIFGRTNAHGVPAPLLIIQGMVVTAMTLPFLFMKDVSTAFLILTALSGTVYLVMYIMMFATAIKLRYSMPNIERHFEVPGGKIGMWIIASLGIVISMIALVLSFTPPDASQIDIGNPYEYVGLVVGIFVVIVLIGVFIPMHPDRLPDEEEHQNA